MILLHTPIMQLLITPFSLSLLHFTASFKASDRLAGRGRNQIIREETWEISEIILCFMHFAAFIKVDFQIAFLVCACLQMQNGQSGLRSLIKQDLRTWRSFLTSKLLILIKSVGNPLTSRQACLPLVLEGQVLFGLTLNPKLIVLISDFYFQIKDINYFTAVIHNQQDLVSCIILRQKFKELSSFQ